MRNFLIYMISCIILLKTSGVASQCKPLQWLCDDAINCISVIDRCDGVKHCPDGSDETAMNCLNVTQCASNSFLCTYGACIPAVKYCNGIADCVDKSDEYFCKGNTMRANLQGSCSSPNHMQCLSLTKCIDIKDVCDGHAHCDDGSDETYELCGNLLCPNGFQCAYGACVSGYARCNGTIECHDRSDEAWALCNRERILLPLSKQNKKEIDIATKFLSDVTEKPLTQITADALPCAIPSGLDTVIITSVKDDTPILPNSLIPDDESIRVKCKDNISKFNDLFCINGVWDGTFPKCGGFCDPTMLKGLSTTHICLLKGQQGNIFCSPAVLANVTVNIYCAIGYDREYDDGQQLKCLDNGNFNGKRIPCRQRCGQLVPKSGGLTRNAFLTIPSEGPWHVAIYRNDGGDTQTHICGGSIISPRLIVTAAHCFWNKTVPLPKSLFRLKAGKAYRNYIDSLDEGYPQESEFEDIYISSRYKDKQKDYYADIAVVKLKTPLVYTENISAICMENPEFDNQDYVRSGLYGIINGYGRNGHMERLNMSTISYTECENLTDEKKLANDKFCLRIDNTISTLCQGDSGGGFAQKREDGYHLVGIVSYSPTLQQECVTAPYVGMSNVKYMKQDLLKIWMSELEKENELL